MNPRVIIAVPAWNEEACIAGTIESLLDLEYPNYEIVVVDDASTDRTAEIVRRYPVRLIQAERNQGSKSRALNLVSLDGFDIFVCVDADTTLDYDALGLLVRAFNDPLVVIASGNVNARQTAGNFWQSGRAAEYVTGQKIAKEAQNAWGVVLVASGCFFAVRTWFLAQHGFSERTIAEDMDLTWTAREQGWKIEYVKEARCHVQDPHDRHSYRSQVSRWYRGYFQCIKARRGNLFGRWVFGIVAYLYIFVNVTGQPLFWIAAYAYPWHSAFSVALSFIVLAIYHRDLGGIARMFVLAPLNYLIFMEAMMNELFLGRRLTVWVKGH